MYYAMMHEENLTMIYYKFQKNIWVVSRAPKHKTQQDFKNQGFFQQQSGGFTA